MAACAYGDRSLVTRYGCAVLVQRLGGRHVTSVDVDAYLGSLPVYGATITPDGVGDLRRGRWRATI